MAHMIKDIKLLIGDNIESKQFNINIAGRTLQIEDIKVMQQQAEPATVQFDLWDKAGTTTESYEAILKAITGQRFEFWYRTHNPTGENDYDDDDPIAFDGIIFNVETIRDKDSNCITVTAKSRDALMTSIGAYGCKSYTDCTLEEIVRDVIEEYEINCEIHPTYTEVIPYCVRYNETAYQFLLRLAQRYGQWIYNSWGVFHFGELLRLQTPTYDLVFPNKDITEFCVNTNLSGALSHYVASSYNSDDHKVQEETRESTTSEDSLAGAIFKTSKDVFKVVPYTHMNMGGFSDNDSKDSILNKIAETVGKAQIGRQVRYCITTDNNKICMASRYRVIEEKRINGKKVRHESEVIVADQVSTHIRSNKKVTIDAWGAAEATIAPCAVTMTPYPTSGPCRAKVTENEDGNQGMGRVRVQFDWQAAQDPTMMTPWIRIATPYAGGGKGFNFIPEIGEEVMVDFEGGNAERPYVVGMMVNGKNKVDDDWASNHNERNRVKAIRTRNGHTIEFHDEDTGGGYIRIYDKGKENYVIRLDTDNSLITIESKGNIEIEAQKDLVLRAGHDILMHADNDISADANKGVYTMSGEDYKTTVKRDRVLSVKHNDEVTVEQNQTIEVKNNYELEAKSKLQMKASSVRVEADQDLKESSTNHSIDAKSSYGVSSNGSVDIKGNITKIN